MLIGVLSFLGSTALNTHMLRSLWSRSSLISQIIGLLGELVTDAKDVILHEGLTLPRVLSLPHLLTLEDEEEKGGDGIRLWERRPSRGSPKPSSRPKDSRMTEIFLTRLVE